MHIEKISDDKIKITLDINDLIERNINFHSFMSNSLENQDVFLDLLKEAESKVGFKTQNHKLVIEAILTSEGTFIFTITKLSNKPVKLKTLDTKRKIQTLSKLLSIYKFNSFDDLCDFSEYLNINNLSNYSTKFKSSLYELNNNYFLILENMRLNLKELKKFCSALSEFSTYMQDGNLLHSKLKEYGNAVTQKGALKTIVNLYIKNL